VGTCGYVAVGSSLKFCIVAEGEADIYPRASPTREWDTAAGHAVLVAAGGLVDGPDGTPLHYGKRAFLNRAFVATAGWKPPLLQRFLEPFAGGGDLPEGV
jgi:3'(2'), 5'-bisphosphate nucleotidase